MNDSEVIPPLVDPMVSGFVEVMMAQPLPSGAADYDRVRGAFIALLTEFMAPQPAEICQRMQDQFARDLRSSIRAARMPKLNVVS